MIPAAYRANVNSNFHFFFFYHEKKKINYFMLRIRNKNVMKL